MTQRIQILCYPNLPDKYWEAPFMDKLKADFVCRSDSIQSRQDTVPPPPENYYNEEYYWPRDTRSEFWQVIDDDVPEGNPVLSSRIREKHRV